MQLRPRRPHPEPPPRPAGGDDLEGLVNDDSEIGELAPALVIAMALWIVPVVIILLAKALF